MDTKLIKPAPGRRVRHPDDGYRPLYDAGELVNWSSYWERALSVGDIVLLDSKEPAAAADEPPADTAGKAPKKGAGDN
jgi:hypothetical protein